MDKLFLSACAIVLVTAVSSTATTACQKSYDCGTGMCCRDASGSVLTDQQNGGFGPLQPIGSNQHGTCSSMKAQKGEVCDSTCDCDTGFTCYRPMSGVCCPPRRCYDDTYVKQQQAYWSNCMSNPNCAIPP